MSHPYCVECWKDDHAKEPRKIGWLARLVRRFFGPKPKRLELRICTYAEGELLVRQGWTIAPEEDHNRVLGLVWLERLDTPNAGHLAAADDGHHQP